MKYIKYLDLSNQNLTGLIKKFELFNGGNITKAILKDIEMYKNKWDNFMISIVYNDYKYFKNHLDEYNLEDFDINGNTPLLLSAKYGNLKMLKVLIEKGSNIYHKNIDNKDFYDLIENDKIKKWVDKNMNAFVISRKYNL